MWTYCLVSCGKSRSPFRDVSAITVPSFGPGVTVLPRRPGGAGKPPARQGPGAAGSHASRLVGSGGSGLAAVPGWLCAVMRPGQRAWVPFSRVRMRTTSAFSSPALHALSPNLADPGSGTVPPQRLLAARGPLPPPEAGCRRAPLGAVFHLHQPALPRMSRQADIRFPVHTCFLGPDEGLLGARIASAASSSGASSRRRLA